MASDLDQLSRRLDLARAIARAHGGDILAASHPNQGSTFEVILPKSQPLRS